MKQRVYSLLVIFCIVTTTFIAGCSSKKNVRVNSHSVVDRRVADAVEIDKDLEAVIKENLHDDEEFHRFAHVNVTVYNGAVLLTGEAMNETIKTKVVEMVRIVKNVKRVHDYLIVDHLSDNLSRADDRRITQNIKQALKQIHDLPNFDSSLVKIITEQRTVYLMGRVHRVEGTVVINVVRLEPDIRQLVTVFDYID